MAQQFSGLPMDALIGGPLNAAATANAAMAMTQTKFMLDTCFNPISATGSGTGSGGQNSYEPIMIVMSLSRPVIVQNEPTSGSGSGSVTFDNITTAFNLPLLTIIPLNSLGVDNVEVTFEMEVQSSYSDDTSQSSSSETSGSASLEAKFGWGPISATITGKASYDQKDAQTHNTHYQKSNSAKYTVNVHAGQLPLPKGVNVIIEAFTNAIQPVNVTV